MFLKTEFAVYNSYIPSILTTFTFSTTLFPNTIYLRVCVFACVPACVRVCLRASRASVGASVRASERASERACVRASVRACVYTCVTLARSHAPACLQT